MKTRNIIIAALSCTLTLTSCEDFLNMQPSTAVNASTAIRTADDARTAINGIMRAMSSSSYYGRNFILYGDTKGGDLTIYSAGRGQDALYSFNHSATSGSYSAFWSQGFYCIMQVNNLLENIERLESEGKTGFDQFKGEALTLRALFNFDLVRLYGLPYNYKKDSYGIPDVTTTLSADAKPLRATVEENYKRIVEDLEAAEPLLELKPASGYVNYYANKALQARVALYREDYAAALAASREIIDSERYRLYSNIEWVDSWEKPFASESIFELGMNEESDLGTSSLGFYYMAKHKNGNQSALGWFLASEYFLTRLGEDPSDVRWGIMGEDEASTADAPRKGACYKYMGSEALTGAGNKTATAVNIKIIRLSEVYLIAAEAALHTGDKAAAAEYLNAIRSRSPQLAPATVASISDDMILDERSKELFGEGHRFFDMIRMNRSIEFNDDFQGVPISQRPKIIDRSFGKIVLPISNDEIVINPAIKEQQNEAYK